jgi:mycothiol synthase
MTISARPYSGATDLNKIQMATAEWIAAAGFRGYMNVSDIALRLFNGMRKYNPREIVRLWESADGRVVGWGMAYPAWNSYEVLLDPDYRQRPLAEEILDWAERETINQMQKAGRTDRTLQVDVFDGDAVRSVLLEKRGYSPREQRSTISTRSLDDSIPQPQFPTGFRVRSAQGEQEADKLVALINNSFGWSWTVEGYQAVMRSPGYRAENELVVVAPDGLFAASCILLPDDHNRTGMFENVGTSRDFRRLGLAKALLYAGMQRMKAQGFTLAMVPHGVGVTGAEALYASVGFRPTYNIIPYSKVVT